MFERRTFVFLVVVGRGAVVVGERCAMAGDVDVIAHCRASVLAGSMDVEAAGGG